MAQCTATNRRGERCRKNAISNGVCDFHGNPGRAKQLSALGVLKRSQPRFTEGEKIAIPKTYADLVESLKSVYAQVANGEMDRDTGRILGNLASAIFTGFKLCGEAEELTRLREMLAAGPSGVPRPRRTQEDR